MIAADPNWKPLPFKPVLIGHLLTGVFYGMPFFFISSVILWLIGAASLISLIALVTFLALLVTETFSAGAHQLYAKRVHHNEPGGWFMVGVVFMLRLLGYVGLTALMTLDMRAVNAALIALLVTEALTWLVVRPWEPGLDMQQNKEVATKVMERGREIFDEDK